MPKLIVISGPANSGKLAKAWEIAAADPELRFLHRDQVRVLFGRLIDESHLTHVIRSVAITLLESGYGVVTAAQNLSPTDFDMWNDVAKTTGSQFEWVSTLAPAVKERKQ